MSDARSPSCPRPEHEAASSVHQGNELAFVLRHILCYAPHARALGIQTRRVHALLHGRVSSVPGYPGREDEGFWALSVRTPQRVAHRVSMVLFLTLMPREC